ncbi:unnamed protein product [Bursaphelenchus okinawaensis]|uniref:DSBA-like thioredoxin domain-containing protein n=1 Tax=Bursaphelenchus okinawaensis TaxID=465554 RepID=A0A811K3T4_9BILA|nr:unnamed protein product [Bursaphelenchus okinawaensis]CAG9091169.1 unnamed protein product [Bursaphelenchus okinawaensis]
MFEHLFAAHRTTGLKICLKPVRSASLYVMTGHRNPYYVVPFRNYMFKEIEQYKQVFGVPARLPSNGERVLSQPGTIRAQSFLAHIQLKHPEWLEVTSRFLWKRLWVQDKSLLEEEDFKEVISELSLPSTIPLKPDFDSLSKLKANETEAVKAGAFATPFCIVDNEFESAGYHGVDRWPIVAKQAGLDKVHRGFYSLKVFNHLFDKALEASG